MNSSLNLPGGLQLSPSNYKTRGISKDSLQTISLSALESLSISSQDLPGRWSEDEESERLLLSHQDTSKAKRSPVDLLEVIDPTYIRADHLELLNDYLLRCERREIRRLMIFMPPQHGKSTTTSKGFASHWIGSFPDEPVLLASYGQSWAEHWGRETRDVLEEYGGAIWGLNVRQDSKAAGRWQLEGHKGGMTAVGIGGSLTGRGAGLLLMDDVVKDQEEARSPVIQQRNIDWYQSVAKTRLAQNGVQVLIMTRWHENDLAGYLLRTEGHAWTVLMLPALAEREDDALERVRGAALWPDKFDAGYLEEIRFGARDPETGQRKGGTTAYWFNAMYQQRPTEEEGGRFKRHWWQFYTDLPAKPISGFNAIDTAGYDTKPQGDYAVIHSACRLGPNLYSTNLQRGHWEFPELAQRARNIQAENGWPLLIEDVPWAKPLIQSLRQLGCSVVPFAPGGHSKEARADAVSPFVEAARWFVPIGASWVDDFIEEHASFPNGVHDDQVDTTSMLGLRLLQSPLPTMAQRQSNPVRRVPVASGWRGV
jgi:predicted phage terminase large subunit-like protein